MVHPCSTCLFACHRKCLLDWVNALPSSKVYCSYEQPDREDSQANLLAPNEPVENGPDINLVNFAVQTRWMSVLGNVRNLDRDDRDDLTNLMAVLLLAECPQCKSQITFRLSRLPALALTSFFKSLVRDMVQYLAIIFGILGAATGVITMGYVGLAKCGIQMLDAVVPQLLLVPLLTNNRANSSASFSNLWKFPLDRDRMAQAMYQLKLQLIPTLPAMLVRMRYSLPLSCFFASSLRLLLARTAGEFLLCHYISSLGNHTLLKQLWANCTKVLGRVWAKPFSLSLFRALVLLRNIDWWDPSVMVGALVPVRWMYDLFFYLTFNRAHFDALTSVRPTAVANSMSESELTRLETLQYKVSTLHQMIVKKSRETATSGSVLKSKIALLRLLVSDDTLWRFIKTRLSLSALKTRLCLRTDYSTILSNESFIVTAVSTVVWPFLASDLGKFLYRLVFSRLSYFEKVPQDKVVFLANLAGFVGVAIAKDIMNLYLSRQKAQQLGGMVVVPTPKELTDPSLPLPERLPGTVRAPGTFD